MPDTLNKEKKNIMVKKKKAWASLDELLNPSSATQQHPQSNLSNKNEVEKLDQSSNTHNAAPLHATTPPNLYTNNFKLDDSRDSNSLRNNSVTNTKQLRNNDDTDSVSWMFNKALMYVMR